MSGLLRRMKRSRGTGAGEVPATGQDAAAEAATTPPTGPEPASDTSFRRPSADDGDRDTTAAEPDTMCRRPGARRAGGGPDARSPSRAPDEAERRPAPFLESEEGEHRPGPFVDS